MMQNARRQAETYVFLLDADHAAPPFLIVADVGNVFELYADFTGTGRAYSHFPDRKGFRIYLEDLRKPEIRERLIAVWTDPQSLDATKKAARVTREIAKRLAAVSKALEVAYPRQTEEIAHFLMRCIFTMFAEDVDLLPKGAFSKLLEDCVESPAAFAPLLNELWAKMDEKDAKKRFYSAFRTHLKYFNGNLFKNAKVYPLGREEIGELLAAAKSVWTEVDPAIFGTLLEQALDPAERKKLGAHYTPRAYVQRLVDVTVMEPLRADWQAALTKAEQAKDRGDDKRAVEIVRGFLHVLCATRVLDPACGTGNFLYVALELMKTLEGDVLETLAKLGEPESMGLDRETVDPHQFLGLELNPRAAAIAELVVWIGYLQQHYRTRTGHPSEPILRAFKNINFGKREGYDAVLTWDGYPVPTVVEKDGKRVETYPNARRPEWPEAEFIVGNPPFIGASDLRSELGDGYAETLWKINSTISESSDFVLFWWDRSADLLTREKTKLKRFGLVTTNSISQVLLRKTIEKWLVNTPKVSIIFAIPDHPWTKTGKDTAVVRIAMTAVELGEKPWILWETVSEKELDSDDPSIELISGNGIIFSDLSIGIDVTQCRALRSSTGICHDGVKLHGSGFLIKRTEAQQIGLGRRDGLDQYIRPYRNGRDLTYKPRNFFVIDFFGLEADQIRANFPEAYQYLVDRVRYDLDTNGIPRVNKKNKKKGREWNNRKIYRERWWIFGEPRSEMRPAITDIDQFIATVDTAKHRIFQFVFSDVVLDDKSVIIADKNAAVLSILSSQIHVKWAVRSGGWLGQGNDAVYTKTRTFDPFPFPDTSEPLRQKLRDAGEELDALRKSVQADHSDLTLTGLYNVLEKIKAGAPLTDKDDDVKRRGLVLILKELHETIDRLTFDAYGWPHDLTDEQILERLVALNVERAKEEAAGHVRWLRPDYQIPRFAKGVSAKTGELDLVEAPLASIAAGLPAFPSDPYEQPLAVEAQLAAGDRPLDAAELAAAFKGRAKGRADRIAQVLATLARYGRVTALPDGRYAARRAA